MRTDCYEGGYVVAIPDLPLSVDRIPKKPKLADIKRVVATHYAIGTPMMEHPNRSRQWAIPRQIGMYLARAETNCSYPQIGRAFGGRDHTTVLYAYRKIKALVAADPLWDNEMKILRQKVLETVSSQPVVTEVKFIAGDPAVVDILSD